MNSPVAKMDKGKIIMWVILLIIVTIYSFVNLIIWLISFIVLWIFFLVYHETKEESEGNMMLTMIISIFLLFGLTISSVSIFKETADKNNINIISWENTISLKSDPVLWTEAKKETKSFEETLIKPFSELIDMVSKTTTSSWKFIILFYTLWIISIIFSSNTIKTISSMLPDFEITKEKGFIKSTKEKICAKFCQSSKK